MWGRNCIIFAHLSTLWVPIWQNNLYTARAPCRVNASWRAKIQRISTKSGSSWHQAHLLGIPPTCVATVLAHASKAWKDLETVSLEILESHTLIYISIPLFCALVASPNMILFLPYRRACSCHQHYMTDKETEPWALKSQGCVWLLDSTEFSNHPIQCNLLAVLILEIREFLPIPHKERLSHYWSGNLSFHPVEPPWMGRCPLLKQVQSKEWQCSLPLNE